VRLHGHRGARGIWPENTMLGFQNTFDLGVQTVELDILLTKDNIPVVTHNPTLMPDTTRDERGAWVVDDRLKISDFTYNNLRRLDVGGIRSGSDYAARYAEQAFLFGHEIPTLANVAALCGKPTYQNTWLNIEIKSTPLHKNLTPPPSELARHTLDVIQSHGLQNRVIVQSFDWRVLREVEAIDPDIPRSHLTYLDCAAPVMQPNIYANSPWMADAASATQPADLPRIIADMGGSVWSPFHQDVTPSDVAAAQDLGLIVNAWTVNTPDDIERIIDTGVDGIITDYPARVQRCLLQRGLLWREDLTTPC
jgi:glycerophosphoryl diester phosphodiesterase